MLTDLGPIPLITSVVVSILVTQRIREAREEELRDLNQILERLDRLDSRLAGLGVALDLARNQPGEGPISRMIARAWVGYGRSAPSG